jgi:hypothetical protein
MKYSNYPIKKILYLVLLCTSFVLAYTLWLELTGPVVLSVNTSIDNKFSVPDIVSLQETPGEKLKISNYKEIIERPLFFENRKPYVFVGSKIKIKQSNKKNQPAPKKIEQYALKAVVISSNVKLAFIERGRKKSLIRIALGESIDGWKLKNIESRSILLIKGNETKTIDLEVKTSKPQKKTVSKNNNQTTNKTASKKR